MPQFDFQSLISILIVIFFAIGLHEYAHAKIADAAGDPTPRYYGRVTLNLFKHFDPLGTIMIVLTALYGFGIGWGKPVPMDPRKMGNPRWDHFMAVAAGPISNLIQAGVFSLALRFVPGLIDAPFFGNLLIYGVMINIGLFCFNLLPLGPLDGMWLLGTFLDEKARLAWTRWNLTIGQFVFLGLVLVGQMVPELNLISRVIRPVMQTLFRFLMGVP
ncbi:MAG: site-2 protease family protein [Armatimonadetes bacterium]|nr:site-2 protease family protein [Armatimonadota bacterium]